MVMSRGKVKKNDINRRINPRGGASVLLALGRRLIVSSSRSIPCFPSASVLVPVLEAQSSCNKSYCSELQRANESEAWLTSGILSTPRGCDDRDARGVGTYLTQSRDAASNEGPFLAIARIVTTRERFGAVCDPWWHSPGVLLR